MILRRFLAFVFLSAAVATAQTADPMDLVKQGRKLANEGQIEQAEKLYMDAVHAAPDLYEAHFALGTTLDLDGKYDEARHHLERALELAKPEAKPQATRALAVSYAFQSKAADAIRYDQPLIEKYMADGNFAQAADVANELARLCLESGDAKDAMTWYRTGHDAALKNPKITPAEKDLWDFRWEHAQARIAARAKNKADAEKHVAAAKAIFDKGTNPDQAPFVPYLTGYVAYYLGDYKTALADLQKGNQRDPFILVLIAQAYEKTGDSAQAMEYYKKVMGFNMHNPTNAFARPIAKKKVRS